MRVYALDDSFADGGHECRAYLLLTNSVKRAYLLADGAPVQTTSEGGRTLLNIVRPILDPMATVVVVEIEGGAVTR